MKTLLRSVQQDKIDKPRIIDKLYQDYSGRLFPSNYDSCGFKTCEKILSPTSILVSTTSSQHGLKRHKVTNCITYSASPSTKLNYSSLARKFNLLNNKGMNDLQHQGCLFTQRYYTEEINYHLLITLYKSQPLILAQCHSRLHCKYRFKLNQVGSGRG